MTINCCLDCVSILNSLNCMSKLGDCVFFSEAKIKKLILPLCLCLCASGPTPMVQSDVA